jgi:hypothetical protein
LEATKHEIVIVWERGSRGHFIFGSPGEPMRSCGIRRLLSSYVSMARFVTAGAIDTKLCTCVSLGKNNSQIKFQSSLILGLATRGPKLKTLISRSISKI